MASRTVLFAALGLVLTAIPLSAEASGRGTPRPESARKEATQSSRGGRQASAARRGPSRTPATRTSIGGTRTAAARPTRAVGKHVGSYDVRLDADPEEERRASVQAEEMRFRRLTESGGPRHASPAVRSAQARTTPPQIPLRFRDHSAE